METMTEIGTEKRLDELSIRVDADFRETRAEVRDLRAETRSEFAVLRTEMNTRFDRLEARFDSLNRTIIMLLGSTLGTIAAGCIVAAFTAFN